MSAKTTVIMGIVLIGLLSLFMFGKRSTDLPGSKAKIFDMDADDVTSFSIDRAVGARPGESPSPSARASASPAAAGPRTREKLAFEKSDGRWILTSPAKALASASDVNNLLTTLVDMRENETLDQPNDQAFGFTDPEAVIELKTKDATHKVVVGRTTVTDDGYYMKVDDKPKVVVSGLGLSPMIARSMDGWRNKSLLAVEPSDVTKWSLVRDNHVLTLEKSEKGWQLTQPYAAPADETQASNVVFQMKNVSITGFPTHIAADDPRLAKPLATFSVWTKDSKSPETVTIGARDPEAKGYYALRGPTQEVVVIPDKAIVPLAKTAVDLEDKHLVAFDAGTLTNIDLTSGSDVVEAKKNDMDWDLTRPAGAKDVMHRMATVISQLHDLTWVHKDTAKDAAANKGFSPPALSIVLHQDKDVVGTVQFGNTATQGSVYARLAEHPDTVYQVKGSVVTLLRNATTALATAPSPSPSGSAKPAVSGSTSPAASSASPSHK
ncbi:MAG TPA: DUF4340 domain-containing protein [Candidatus Xenobia bacterium]|jgi:hypothetical protein